MRIKTVSASYERKFNMDNYESLGVGMSAWAEVEEEEDPELVVAVLRDFLKAHTAAMARMPLKGRTARRRRTIQQGLEGVRMAREAKEKR